MHYYITGVTHGDFSRIAEFCDANGTDTDDVMIILGDAGIKYANGDCAVAGFVRGKKI